METTEAFRGLECTDCGAVHDVTAPGRCPDCGGALDAIYDYDAVGPEAFASTGPERSWMWAFDDLLPIPGETGLGAGEGDTPTIPAPRLAEELGVDAVLIKDEGANPTSSVHDRGLSLTVSVVAARAEEGDDVEPLALATPGNSGQSMAAYAGRAGLRSYAFVPSRCAFSNKAMVNVHGGDMRVVGGRFDDAAGAVDEQLAADYTDLGEFATPYRHEGAKTIAFELARDHDWTVPDAVVVPTATGELVVGLAKGFRELEKLGLVDEVPRIAAAQADGCAPIATAWDRGAAKPAPWEVPDTIAGELEIPDPAGGALALEALAETGGTAVTATDEEILESAVAVAQNEVVEMGAAAGVAPAGAWNLAQEGWFDADDTVALINTESGLKTPDVLRSHLMGKGV